MLEFLKSINYIINPEVSLSSERFYIFPFIPMQNKITRLFVIGCIPVYQDWIWYRMINIQFNDFELGIPNFENPQTSGFTFLNIFIDIFIIGTFPDHVIGEEVIADYLLYSLNRQNINTLVIFSLSC